MLEASERRVQRIKGLNVDINTIREFKFAIITLTGKSSLVEQIFCFSEVM